MKKSRVAGSGERRGRGPRMAALAGLVGLLFWIPASAGASAAAAPALAVRVVHNVTYTTGTCPGRGTEAEKADLYLPSPPPSGAVPAVILAHEGSFVHGSKTGANLVSIAEDLASDGWAAISIDYCLPPEGTPGYPVEVQNVESALTFFSAHAAKYGLAPRHMALWGGSAGASLAVDAATLIGKNASPPSVAAAVGWSGGYDFLDGTGAKPSSIANISNYLGCQAGTPPCVPTETAASAVTNVGSATPPTFLANSTHELVPLNQLTDMQDALTQAKIPTQSLVIPGSLHAFAYKATAYCPTVSFLETYLGNIQGTCTAPDQR
ncbi:MAG TPA: alpha/beta hydrolase [Streptosporangiaceae bacterium]